MSKKQVYMSIYDINPTESFWDKVDDRNLYKEDAKLWHKQELIDDIRENGLKYQLNVDPFGNIKNGNMRYWVARYLLEEENDQRFAFLPVQRNYASGAFYQEFDLKANYEECYFIATFPGITKYLRLDVDKKAFKKALKKAKKGNLEPYQRILDTIGDKTSSEITKQWVSKIRDLTIPHQEEFAVFEIDPIDEFRMKNFWEQQQNTWSILLQPHPIAGTPKHPDHEKYKTTMICCGIASKSGYEPTLVKGSEEEKKAFKEKWKKIREERKEVASSTTLHRERKKIHG